VISSFAVATLPEAVRLRESGIDCPILVLGYTHYEDAELLSKHNLIQMVADGAHAEILNAAGYKLYVHIAVDTGMHREGIGFSDIAEIESIYDCESLEICGFATHLSVSDSLAPDDVDFTKLQVKRLSEVVKTLQNKGYDTGKLHIQASYGALNYPEMSCDLSRAGLALFGGMSRNIKTNIKPHLRPALSVRARIAQIRWVDAGESVSYGRTYTTNKPAKLATVCIGYADGIPRQLSGKGGNCIVHGIKVPIVGTFCMDMLMLDVTGVEHVNAGDIATLIGKDGNEEVRCEDVAEACGTITYDILCRLGSRLPRVYT
jgi:serine/alanine racemase